MKIYGQSGYKNKDMIINTKSQYYPHICNSRALAAKAGLTFFDIPIIGRNQIL